MIEKLEISSTEFENGNVKWFVNADTIGFTRSKEEKPWEIKLAETVNILIDAHNKQEEKKCNGECEKWGADYCPDKQEDTDRREHGVHGTDCFKCFHGPCDACDDCIIKEEQRERIRHRPHLK